MRSKIIEATNGTLYLKAMVTAFGPEDWARPSLVSREDGRERSLLQQEGWRRDHFIIQDLSKPGGGAMFMMGGNPQRDFARAPTIF